MKKTLLLLWVFMSVLLANFTQTQDDTFIDIYADKDPQSSIIATVSTSKGKLTKKGCFTNSDSQRWCKVEYAHNELNIHGYSDEDSLEMINAVPNNKSTFEQTFGGKYDDIANAVIALKDGYMIAGVTASYGKGENDAYVVRVDKFGNKIYSLSLGGTAEDSANAVAELKNSFVIVGATRSFGVAEENIYVAKFSKAGELLWQKGYFTDEDDYYQANAIVKTSDTEILLAGSENHFGFFSTEMRVYVNALDAKGEQKSVQRYGGSDMDVANSIISTQDGYLLAGVTKSSGSGEDAYVIKVDKDGDMTWQKRFGYAHNEVAHQIIQTQEGGYILVGTTASYIQNQQDVYVVKIEADGTVSWQEHYGSQEDEEGYGIVETNDGYVIAGYTEDTLTKSGDVYLLKISKTGSVLWERKYGSDNDDAAKAIIKVEDGFVIVGYKTSQKSLSKDFYMLKVDENGKIN